MTSIVIPSGQSVFDLSTKEQMKWFQSWETRYARYEYEDEMRWGSKKWDQDYLFSWEFTKPHEEYEIPDYSDDSSESDSQSDSDYEDDYFDTF
tara:strand:+ start:30 stop:308 length:279 start_codon:yes stop_codon:yes gene_type:complete